MSVRIQLRRDTAANWTSTNPTLTQGEPGYETDTGKIKYGDGTTAWNSLAYAPAAAIVDGTIVNADISASAAIAGSKISPNFGTQPITTTGTLTSDTVTTTGAFQVSRSGSAAGVFSDSGSYVLNDLSAGRFIPTGSTVPTNGVYLPATNSVAISTNSTGRLFIDSSGRLGIGTSVPQDILHLSSAGNLYLRVTNTSTGINAYLGQDSNGTYIGNTGAADVRFIQGAAERMRLTSTGLGIGTTAPGSILDARGEIRSSNSDSDRIILHQASRSARPGLAGFGDLGGTENGSAAVFTVGQGVGVPLTIGTFGNAYLNFTTNNTERARIDSSGRLLVGTSTSASAGNASVARIQVVGNSTDAAASSVLALNRGEAATSITSGEAIGNITFGDSSGNEFGLIQCIADANAGTNDYPGRLVFSTTADGASSPTERMRIGENGALSLYSNGTNIFSSNANGAGTTYGLFIGRYSATGTQNGTNSIIIYSNGNIQNTNNSYGSLSDLKLKENIVDAKSQWADIKALQVRNYNLKEGQTHRQIGLIAQEVEPISPGLVYETPDRDADGNDLGTVTKSVNYSVLYMKAVKALQEAMERIEQLEAEMAEVKAQLA